MTRDDDDSSERVDIRTEGRSGMNDHVIFRMAVCSDHPDGCPPGAHPEMDMALSESFRQTKEAVKAAKVPKRHRNGSERNKESAA